MSGLVVALVGTDHHPFDRLVRWVDAAATRHQDVRFVVQHGVTRPPAMAEGHDYLGRSVLEALLAEATVVVCHGGPGLLLDAREAGHVPLCVPRDPLLGEHVDGHQQRFAQRVGQIGVAVDVRTEQAFAQELARGLQEGRSGSASIASVTEIRDAARARASAELVALMTAGPAGRLRWRRHVPA